MVMKNDGKRRTTKRKFKKIKCSQCKQVFEYGQEDLIKIGKITYITCPYCGLEVLIKS